MRWFLHIAVGLFFSGFLGAQDTILIESDFKDLYFGDYCSHFIEDQDSLSEPWSINEGVKDVRLVSNVPNVLSTYIRNTTPSTLNYLCFLHNVQVEKAQLFLFANNHLIYSSPITGCLMPLSSRPTSDRTLSLPVVIPPNSIVRLELHAYRKNFGLTISPHLVNPAMGLDFNWVNYIYYSIVICNIFLLMFGVLLLYNSWKYRINTFEITWFVLYIIISIFYVVSSGGFGSMYLWGNFPNFEVNSAIFFGAISGSTFILFCKSVLPKIAKRRFLRLYFNVVAFIYFAVTIPGFWLYHSDTMAAQYTSAIGISYLGFLSCIFIIIYFTFKKAFVEKEKPYFWFIGIFFFYITFTLFVLGLELGLITYNFKKHALALLICYFPQMVVTLVFLIHRFSQGLIQKRKYLTNLRSSIAQDIHDEIGSNLTRISLHSHLVAASLQSGLESRKFMEQVSQQATLANQNLRDLLFTMNPANDKFHHLISYIRNVIQGIVSNSKIEFTESLHGGDFNINGYHRIRIIRLVKEFVYAFIKKERLLIKSIKWSIQSPTQFDITFCATSVNQSEISPLEKWMSTVKAKHGMISDYKISTDRGEMDLVFNCNLLYLK